MNRVSVNFKTTYEMLWQYNMFEDESGSTVIYKSNDVADTRIFEKGQLRCGCNFSIWFVSG